jgi:putative glycosyltransferase (TIGR04372 family)
LKFLQLLSRLVIKLVRGALTIVALVILIVMKVLQPLVRFRILVIGFHRFGHLALEPEVFLSRSIKTDRKVINLWSMGKSGKRANEYLASKWSRAINTQPSWFVGSLQRAGDLAPFLALEKPKLSIHGPGNALDDSDPHLVFDLDEHSEGRRQLKLMGVDCSRPFVCLIVRDGGHYRSVGDTESDGYSFLNFDISNFEEAALALASLGYQVVRMGAGTEKPMQAKHADIFDYAVSEFRNEFMDVYIAGTCDFAVSTQTGPDAVCLAFRRPVYYVDVTRFSQFFFGTQIAYWNPAQIRLNGSRQSLKQILDSPIFWLKDPDDFLKLGVDVVRSTPRELAEMCVAFAKHLQAGSTGSEEWNSANRRVHQILELGMGERGRLVFGKPTAPLNPLFATRHAEWFLE